jgi:hypothetical protein
MRNENQMSTAPDAGIRTDGRSDVGLYVAATLLILYPLSIGPVAFLTELPGFPTGSRVEYVLAMFYFPILWLMDNTEAGGVIYWYIELWTGPLPMPGPIP